MPFGCAFADPSSLKISLCVSFHPEQGRNHFRGGLDPVEVDHQMLQTNLFVDLGVLLPGIFSYVVVIDIKDLFSAAHKINYAPLDNGIHPTSKFALAFIILDHRFEYIQKTIVHNLQEVIPVGNIVGYKPIEQGMVLPV